MLPPRVVLVACLAATFSFSSAAAQTGLANSPDVDIRVRILEREAPATVAISGVDASLSLTLDGRALPSAARGQRVSVERGGNGVSITHPGGRSSGSHLEIRPDAGASAVSAGNVQRTYEGTLSFRVHRGSLSIVNQLPIEPYVASVVAGEYPFPEMEGAKAQAVLARTYALRARANPRYNTADYFLVDHTGDQVYHGAGRATATSRNATQQTAGRVLMHQGEFVRAQYFSSSGGHTADNETVWAGEPVPYLRGQPDPYDSHSPHTRWTSQLENARILQTLSRHYGFGVRNFEFGPRGRDGRVHTVRLTGARTRQISANEFRLVVTSAHGWRSMRSTNVTMRRSGNTVHFEGSGFGHGVGMSQYGAQAQAQQGRSFEEILTYYFQGTTAVAGYGLPGASNYVTYETPEAPVYEGVRTRPTPRAQAEREILGRLDGSDEAANRPRPQDSGSEAQAPSSRETDRTPRRSAW
ncbi:SpoIID/LytB domain-containing protein [soil metagenome]